MVRVRGDITIERPLEEVFDFVADQSNEPRYNPHMIRADRITPGPIGVGTQFHSVMTGVSGGTDMTIEFTEFERPRRITEQVDLSSMAIHGQLLFEPVPAGTRMQWVWDVEPRGLLRFLGPLVRRMGDRQEQAIWHGLKAVMEGRGSVQAQDSNPGSDPLPTAPARLHSNVPSRRVLHAVNPLVAAILRSRFHGLFSDYAMLLTFTGRRSGSTYTTPVGYIADGDTFTTFSSTGWWKNVRGGAPVSVLVKGERLTGRAEVIEDSDAMVAVVERLVQRFGAKKVSQWVGVKLDVTPPPSREEIARAMRGRVVVRTQMDGSPAGSRDRQGAPIPNPGEHSTLRKVLLSCGIAASLLYVAANIVGAMAWKGYSSIDQSVSELFAVDAPSKAVVDPLFIIYSLLWMAFGVGVWRAAGSKWPLRVAGAGLIGKEVAGLAVQLFFPMHMRGVPGTLNDPLHGTLTYLGVLSFLTAMAFGSTAFGRWFRAYSIATLMVASVFAALAGIEIPKMVADEPTPWMGVFERISIFGYLFWASVLATGLLWMSETAINRAGDPSGVTSSPLRTAAQILRQQEAVK